MKRLKRVSILRNITFGIVSVCIFGIGTTVSTAQKECLDASEASRYLNILEKIKRSDEDDPRRKRANQETEERLIATIDQALMCWTKKIEAGDKDLKGAFLRNVSLSNLKLGGADLSAADLTESYLVGTDLTNAKLNGAILKGADLTDADLTGADLNGAIASEMTQGFDLEVWEQRGGVVQD